MTWEEMSGNPRAAAKTFAGLAEMSPAQKLAIGESWDNYPTYA